MDRLAKHSREFRDIQDVSDEFQTIISLIKDEFQTIYIIDQT